MPTSQTVRSQEQPLDMGFVSGYSHATQQVAEPNHSVEPSRDATSSLSPTLPHAQTHGTNSTIAEFPQSACVPRLVISVDNCRSY